MPAGSAGSTRPGPNRTGRNPNRGIGNTGPFHELGTAAGHRGDHRVDQPGRAVRARARRRDGHRMCGAVGGRIDVGQWVAGEPRPDRDRGRPGCRLAPGRRRHLPAMDIDHASGRVHRRPQGVRHRRRTTAARRLGVPRPFGTLDQGHQRRASRRRPAAVHHRRHADPEGQVLRQQPSRPRRRLPEQPDGMRGQHRHGVRCLGVRAERPGQAGRRPDRGVHPRPQPVGRDQHTGHPGPVRRHAIGLGGDAGQLEQARRRGRAPGKRGGTGGLERLHPIRMTDLTWTNGLGMMLRTGISDWLSDTSDDVLKRIAAGAVEANQWMMLKAIDQINSGLRINVGASWLQDVLTMMRYLVLPVVGLLIVDQFSNYLLGGAQTAAQDGIKKAFAMQGAIEGSGWLVVTVIAAVGILAWGTVIIILFLRKAMIIGTLVFAPFAMAGLTSGKTKVWAVKWFEVIVALALGKFVICAILTLAYSAVASSITGDISDALLGSVWVVLAALSPLAVMRFVQFASDQITSANTTGAAAALGNAGRGIMMGRKGAALAGGVAGAVGGGLAGRANAAATPKPAGPAAAVGNRPGAGAKPAVGSGNGPGSASTGPADAGSAPSAAPA